MVGGGRAALLPGVPTFAQAGYDDFVFGNPTWAGIAAPARMPPTALARMAQAIGVSVQDADMREFLVSIGFEAIGNTPQAFEEEYRAERRALLPCSSAGHDGAVAARDCPASDAGAIGAGRQRAFSGPRGLAFGLLVQRQDLLRRHLQIADARGGRRVGGQGTRAAPGHRPPRPSSATV